jgi:hypothetical protein
MPLNLNYTDGVLPAGAEQQAISRITDAFLKWHGLTGNKVMTPNITAMVTKLPKGATFGGGKPISGAWLEVRSPSFAFSNREIQRGFFADATAIIHELSGNKLPQDNIYTNVVHTVDGTWNLDGRAMSNAEIGEAIAKG